MNRLPISLGLALAALSLLSVATPAHAEGRPIHAEGQGYFGPNDYWSPFLFGTGKGLHLGKCTLFIYLGSYDLFEGNVVPTFVQFTAANGDNLNAAIDSDLDPETGIILAKITFAGGTGRFAGAKGSARLCIVPDAPWFDYGNGYPDPFEMMPFSWDLEGTIQF